MAAKETSTAAKKKFNIEGHQEIPVSKIHPNPRNPRPFFHFGSQDEENPEIVELGDSIRTDGLHNPLRVFELLPEAPGEYRIVQGHRRYEAARVAGLDAVECLVYSRPRDDTEELEMLGSEDAHKRAWSESGLMQMKHAWELSKQLGLPSVNHNDIRARTGLTRTQLEIADKIFKLEPEVLAMLIEYERVKYEQLIAGQRKTKSRLTGAGVRTNEFPPERAALVWELFEALRQNFTMAMKKYEDVDLQVRLAQASTGSFNTDSLRNIIAAVRSNGNNAGLISNIDDLLNNPSRTMRDLERSTQNTHITKLAKVRKDVEALDTKVEGLAKNIRSIGGDIDLIKDADSSILRLIMHLQALEAKLQQTIRDDEKKRQN